MAGPWLPPSATPVDETPPQKGPWLPPGARVVVVSHTRAPRYNPARLAVESGAQALGVPLPATDIAIDQLPAIGAFIPNPGGPALGAAGGAVLRQALSDQPPKPMTAGLVSGVLPAAQEPGSLASRLLDVAEQVGVARAADLIGPGMKWAGKGLSRMAMNLTPEAGKTAIEEGILATKAGFNKLMSKIHLTGQATKDIVASVPDNVVFQPRDLLANLNDNLIPKLQQQPITVNDLKTVGKWNAQLLKSHEGPWTASELHVIKQNADRIATPIYAAIERKDVLAPGQELWGKYNKQVADWAREQLGGTTLADGTRVGGLPGGLSDAYNAANARESQLIRLKDEAWPTVRAGEKGGIGSRMAKRTSGYTVGAATLGGVGGMSSGHNWQQRTVYGLLGSLAGAGLSSPQALSLMSMIAANPELASILTAGARSGIAAATAPQP